ncbi:beta strand repeat-containing protein [Deinococcus taklimakanensis]|uniref:Beta strand repeat-containing protein n=1 Tax=Deinococcus taklimakanensis TaxID=536443 RepID=A0ABW5P3Y3_9DEIO
MNKKYTLLPLLTATLVACGGGGTPSPANEKPMVSLKRADGSVITTATYLGADDRIIVSSSDADGNITKVQWKIDDKAGEFSGTDVKSRLELPLTGLSNGTHTAEVTVTDNAGATATASTTFNVDAVAPAISKITLNGTQVASGSTTNLTIGDAASLTVTATDSRGTEAAAASPATIRIMEGTSVRATGTNTVTADLSKAADGKDRAAGPVTFTIIAKDSAGNSTASTTTLNFTAAGTVDTTKPTFTWLSPSADFVPGNSSVTVRASASRSGSEVKEAIVYTATCGTVVNGNWNTAGCEDGSKQVVTATVTIGGKAYSDTKTVTVDASAPTVQITSPNTGTEVTGNPVKVNLTATDAVSGVATVVLEASRDGGAFEQVGVLTTASGEITWAPSNGSYTLRATATDRTGNRNTTTVTGINVKLTSSDKTAPTVNGLEILNKAASGVERGTVTAQVTATDADSGVAKVELFDGGTSLGVQTAGVGGKYTFTLDTTKLSDGAHTLRAVATDNVGLSSQTSLTIQTDNTAPAVTWLSPTDGSMVGGTVNLNATTNEGTVEYTVDGEKVTGTSYTFKADGAHTITANATDKAGNTTTSTIKVTSDATAPTAQITSPAQGATITSNPVTVSVNGSDNLSGVKSLEVFANGTSIGTVNGESGTVTWAPQSGDYALTVIATDKAGNRSAAGTPVNVKMQLATADTTRPVFLTTPTLQPAPQNGLSRGNVVVDGNVTDAETGISTVALFDGGLRLSATPSLSKNPDGSTRYAFTLDTRTLSDGPHTLVVQATNGVGLTENKEVAFNIDNTAPVLTWNAPSFVGPTESNTLLLNASSESGASITYAATCGSINGNTWNYKDCADGVTATLTATATDPAGNTTNMTSTITVDMSAPTVQITGPQNGQKFTQNPITVTVNGTDNLGIERIEVFGNTVKIGTVNGAQGTVTWAAPNGTHTIRAIAYDRAGNKNEVQVEQIQVALASSSVITPNTPTVSGTTAGSNPTYLRGLGTVEGSAFSTAGITSGQLVVDGQSSGTSSPASDRTPVRFTFDFNTLNEGLHDIGIRWTDAATAVKDSAKVSVYVDKTAPVITWNTPANGSVTNNKEVALDATATDNASGVASVSYSENGTPLNSTFTEGVHTVTATATDKVGNTASQALSFTVDTTGPVITATSPTNAQEFTSGPVSISATATDNLSSVQSMEATIQGPGDTGPITLGVQSGARYAATFTPVTAGTYTINYTAKDSAGNVASTVTRTFTYSVTIAPAEKAPKPRLTVVGLEEMQGKPFSGNISVNVSANRDDQTLSQIDRMILQTTDKNGVVDNSTYTTTQEQATFSVDTTKLANGPVTLKVIAITKTGLVGTSDSQPVEVFNILNPVLAVAAPSDGATVTTPSLPVRVTLTKNGDTTFQLPSQTIKIELLDSRGRVAVNQDDVVCQSTAEGATYTCNYTFDIAALPADTYTIRTTAVVTVNGVSQQLVSASRFTSNTTSVLPPAATIRFPAITSLRTPARIDSSSGFMVNVSDNTGVAVVEARLVGPFDATKQLAPNGTTQCVESAPVGNPVDAVNVLLLNQGFSPLISLGDVILPNLDIDGSAYVPDNDPNERYDLRVTVVDSEGNRNIQCIPVTINRAATKEDRSLNKYEATATTSPTPANTAPGELNYLSGTWTLTGLTNSSRVAGVLYINGVQKNISFTADAKDKDIDKRAKVTVAFGDEGVYSINWLVEDMTTGIVTSVAGPSVTVKKNKE